MAETMKRPSFSLLSIVLCALLLCTWMPAINAWRKGRATFYGGPNDYWSIHEGSCGYGYLDQDKATGWDIAAMSDACDDYSGGCGRCYEIKCDSASFNDNYGEGFDRTSACYDPEASVVVQVTDTCPCDYPKNAYSNKRWCCGDMYHFDISIYAFEKLADVSNGVIGVQMRPVSCGSQPYKKPQARSVSGPNTRITRPDGWTDKRPF